jgi:hypothetical protein
MPNYERWRAKIKPMGQKRVELAYVATISLAEAEHARGGLLPDSMDDKWSGFWNEGEIGFYRSWTGKQIYILRVKPLDSGYEVGPLEVVDDPSVYRRSDDAADLKLASILLGRLIKRDASPA